MRYIAAGICGVFATVMVVLIAAPILSAILIHTGATITPITVLTDREQAYTQPTMKVVNDLHEILVVGLWLLVPLSIVLLIFSLVKKMMYTKKRYRR